MIHICDAIMGSGKTESAITYMNEHPQKKFVYITPYITETERISIGCPGLHFRLPSDKISDYGFSKVEHTRFLLKEGRNIATTHASFKLYTADMIENIQKHDYTLIIDEAVTMLSEVEGDPADVQLFKDAGILSPTESRALRFSGKEYARSGALADLYKLIMYNDVFRLSEVAGDLNGCEDSSDDDDDDKYFYWETSPETISAFGEVFILTYLFDGQDMKYYLDANHLPYEYIGVSKGDDGRYRFAPNMEYYPGYLACLGDMVRIWDHEKMNAIGNRKHALSKNWFKRNEDSEVIKVKNNVRTFFKYHFKHVPSSCTMWSTFKDYERTARPTGYAAGFVPCNLRASNEYRDRCVLAYCVNLFINPFLKRYLTVGGLAPSDDRYALSVMIQWIWRSAIRDGKPIDIYIPSRRMRDLLREWIKETQDEYFRFAEGGVQNA